MDQRSALDAPPARIPGATGNLARGATIVTAKHELTQRVKPPPVDCTNGSSPEGDGLMSHLARQLAELLPGGSASDTPAVADGAGLSGILAEALPAELRRAAHLAGSRMQGAAIVTHALSRMVVRRTQYNDATHVRHSLWRFIQNVAQEERRAEQKAAIPRPVSLDDDYDSLGSATRSRLCTGSDPLAESIYGTDAESLLIAVEELEAAERRNKRLQRVFADGFSQDDVDTILALCERAKAGQRRSGAERARLLRARKRAKKDLHANGIYSARRVFVED